MRARGQHEESKGGVMASEKYTRHDDHSAIDTSRTRRGKQEELLQAAETAARDTCPLCGVSGRVDVEAFRWDGERHLNWLCHACGRTWTTEHRRTESR